MKRTKNMYYNPTIASEELYLYLDNNARFHESYVVPVYNNLRKKALKGIYDSNKAIDALYRLATIASNMYYKEFGYRFSVTERFSCAYEMELELFEKLYNELI